MINVTDYEIFKQFSYTPIELKNKTYLLSSEPYLDIVLTDYCNSKCGFCIGNLAKDKMNGSLEDQKNKIKEARGRFGVKEVLILGGEPTISNNLFEIIEYCDHLNFNKICMTTNGFRLKDSNFMDKLVNSGVTHINLSVMSLDERKALEINGNSGFLSIEDIQEIYSACQDSFIHLRINSNSFKGSLDTYTDIINHYYSLFDYCDSMKISPLLKTDSFSVCQEVNSWVDEHILDDDTYDEIFDIVVGHFMQPGGCSPIVNVKTLGFVKYVMLPMRTPLILNYNQHGQMKEMLVKYKQINTIKLLANNELSLSWNKELTDLYL